MAAMLHPAAVLYRDARPFTALAACEHYAGREDQMRKALALQAETGPIFDITLDAEDGAVAGQEAEHARLIAATLNSPANRFDRIGARAHDVGHAHWRRDLEIIIGEAGDRVAYLVLPKCGSRDDALTQIAAIDDLRRHYGVRREIPVHVLIETPGALRDVWQIAGLPHVESLDFGLMDFVSSHHGAIPAAAMASPGQFEHPLIVRAKCEIAAAALGNGIVPAHNVTTDFRNAAQAAADARLARERFGFLRMWSIHPGQIRPIVDAMRPDFAEVATAAAILGAAQAADWGPIQHEGRLHDRASYRYFWELLQRASATGMDLPGDARQRFFT